MIPLTPLGDRILQRAGKLEVFRRIGQVDHLLIIGQLQAVQTGAGKGGRKHIVAGKFTGQLRMRLLIILHALCHQLPELTRAAYLTGAKSR